MWISPRHSGRRDSRFTLCRAEPYSGRAAPSRFALAGDCIVVAFAGILSRDVCRLAGPVAANGAFPVYSMVVGWKKARHCRPSGWRDNAEYSVVRHFTEYYRRSGHRNYPGAVDGVLDIAALGFLDLGAQLPSPEWGPCWGMRWANLCLAWTVAARRGDNAQCFTGSCSEMEVRRAIIAGVGQNAVTGYHVYHWCKPAKVG